MPLNKIHKHARISWTLSRHLSLSSIAPGRSSRLHPVLAQSCFRSVLVCHPTLDHPCEVDHWSVYEFVFTSPAVYLIRLILMVFEMSGRWPYRCCFVGCCLWDLFNKARSILVQLPSSLFSIRLVSVHVVHPYSSIDTTAAWKNYVLFYRIGLTSIWSKGYQ